MIKKSIIFVLLFQVIFSTSALSSPMTPEKKAIFRDFFPKIEIIEEIDGPAGFTGVAFKGGGGKSMLWISDEGFLFYGNLFAGGSYAMCKGGIHKAATSCEQFSKDPKTNYTQMVQDKFGLNRMTVRLEESYEATPEQIESSGANNSAKELGLYLKTTERAKTGAFKQGNGRKQVYVYTDYTCPYCQRLHKAVDENPNLDFTFNLLPVSIHNDISEIYGAHWLDGALDINDMVSGNVTTEKAPTAASIAEVKRNRALLAGLGAVITPTILYQDENGEVRSMQGFDSLSDLLEFLN